jgi:sigma-B regulation protein RsbU (phosphoserine phosphatase)
VIIVQFLVFRAEGPVSQLTAGVSNSVDAYFLPLSFLFGVVFTLLYERPIRQLLDAMSVGRPMPPSLWLKARRRLLNEPFCMIGLNLFLWISAASIYPVAFLIADAGSDAIRRAVYGGLSTGLITVTVAFFVLERVLQSRMVPLVFPDGRLSATSGTFPIGIRTRLFALLLACNLVPFIATLTVVHRFSTLPLDPAEAMERLRLTFVMNSLIFMATGIWLTVLVSNNLTRPFGEIIRVLSGIRRGRLDDRVKVTSNDEIGYTGDVINEMTDGLRERERMRQSLDLAKEVQQHLLPQKTPLLPGWDIAGHSVYCDETGGDYFDFLQAHQEGVDIVVGDVSGHGVPSALLMASARSLLRQRARLPGDIADIVTDVNRLLSEDVGESGRFMTLFYLSLSPAGTFVSWVRAGHDPAQVYDPASDRFSELKGAGVALGVDRDALYRSYRSTPLSSGQIILLFTDGIYEACNESGEMFGKERLQAVIRRHAAGSAGQIMEAVIGELGDFQGRTEAEDDVTLVIAKIDG